MIARTWRPRVSVGSTITSTTTLSRIADREIENGIAAMVATQGPGARRTSDLWRAWIA